MMYTHELLAVAVQALKDIENPIAAIERNLQPGETINGQMAIILSDDPNHLREIAKKALALINEQGAQKEYKGKRE